MLYGEMMIVLITWIMNEAKEVVNICIVTGAETLRVVETSCKVERGDGQGLVLPIICVVLSCELHICGRWRTKSERENAYNLLHHLLHLDRNEARPGARAGSCQSSKIKIILPELCSQEKVHDGRISRISRIWVQNLRDEAVL